MYSAGILQLLYNVKQYEMGFQKQRSSYFKLERVHLCFVFGWLEWKFRRLLLLAHFINTRSNVGSNKMCW